MVINQWVPAAHRGDAIGDSARRVRDVLRQMGHQSDIFALTIDDDMKDEVTPFADRTARQGEVTILHFAVPSPMTEAFASLRGGRVLQYHNITPRIFCAYDRRVPSHLSGPAGTGFPWPAASLALGDSAYSRQELDNSGFATQGLPDRGRREPDSVAPRHPASSML